MKVGIFGGSFNPIHVGHVALAKAMLEQVGLDEVWLMVSPQNPLKQQADLLDDALRLEMAQLALQEVEGVKASDFEFHLSKPSSCVTIVWWLTPVTNFLERYNCR